MTKMQLPQLTAKVTSEEMLTEVILEMLLYKVRAKNMACPPWLETKMREAQRDISWLTEVQKKVMRYRSWVTVKQDVHKWGSGDCQTMTHSSGKEAEEIHQRRRRQKNKCPVLQRTIYGGFTAAKG